ncbi:Uncharacterized conserved protein YtfP, gamma-glutamylcyclotransferase (GGCT)/AIG2-like family [Desulfotomaculum arcticum]|uniref:Uncharacterized conserved protein YtfP, gamma-glutamylcyclotransferase (GGCT)/AIG2-like family n=1 Tax=Desulfotruncus arcticus DSM 17038 TaxID=1121424 RepID=A0A1I2YBR4_9FIRM|nr:gamma-glutamylcyclotransferase family protein [Desulfotruncus arcticus]SFH23208.1 Uncharacterized conserved protein YtfP, gamma-glutamylcyclotransferase (GGCT)/AIG2-like family [Desulfotomaculum arcticum] [Desulfotruncus arcticus DSM 17038]
MKINTFKKIHIDKKGYLLIPYFAYGSNLHLSQMKRRCPSAKPLEAVKCHDYRLTFKGNKRGNGVADIEPAQGEAVAGALYRITIKDLEALDRYEGYPRLYNRYIVEVVNAYGEKKAAFVYRMGPQYVEAPPWEEYYETILSGFQNWGLDVAPLQAARMAADPYFWPVTWEDDDASTEGACERERVDSEWWCVNGHGCCIYNDGTDCCTHPGGSKIPLED